MLYFVAAKLQTSPLKMAEYNAVDKTRGEIPLQLPANLLRPKHFGQQQPSYSPSDFLEHMHPLFTYLLHRPSIVCKKNGGGRWQPKEYPEDPDTLVAVKNRKGTIIMKRSWEVKMEEEEEEGTKREKEEIEGVVIIDGGEHDRASQPCVFPLFADFKIRQKPVRPGCLTTEQEVDTFLATLGYAPSTF
ncbi:hypothetical protein BDP27DRAFT_1428300 [Rhodocollybia butyracea]|uniref:Uncharacterized protein n=1 Tax=Rhodocollybia butyracea TaxID=206335 RepID=A0A9P5PG68_9AGAR|nr:hypothetical protein BDP27DRAFT_1428300 [Rhodocollybia butyracea]